MSRVNLDQDFCVILADFGAHGRAFVETDPADATLAKAVRDILDGQVETPVAVVQFNPVEGHSRDVTEQAARALAELVWQTGEPPTDGLRRFLDAHGLVYPTTPEEELAWPARPPLLSPQSEQKVSSLFEQLRREAIPKKPPAPSVSRPRSGAKRSEHD